MVIDLHSHFVPLDAARSAGVGVTLAPQPDGDVRFSAHGRTMTLERALFDLEEQRNDALRQGFSRRMLSIPPFCFQYELPHDDGIRWARSLNDGIAAAIAEDPDMFFGFATLPLQDVDSAIRELDRAVHELSLQGVEIATNINGVELDAPELDPFWERVTAANVPVFIHPHYVIGAGRTGDYYLQNLFGNPSETALAGARLLLGGVLERYPDLRIILSHGGGLLPHLVGRLDHGYQVREETRSRASEPFVQLRRLFYDTIVFHERALRYLVDVVGVTQVVVGTDYPFDMGMTDAVEFVRGAGLSVNETDTVLTNGDSLISG